MIVRITFLVVLSLQSVAYALVKTMSQSFMTVRSANAQSHQKFVVQETELFVHELYAAMNSLRSAHRAEAVTAVQRCEQACGQLILLFDPQKMNHTKLIQSFVCELRLGLAYQQQLLQAVLKDLSDPDARSDKSLHELKKLATFRADFFAQFMQWEIRLEGLCTKIAELEKMMSAMRTAAADGKVHQKIMHAIAGTALTSSQLRTLGAACDMLEHACNEIIHNHSVELETRLYLAKCIPILQDCAHYGNCGQESKLEFFEKNIQRCKTIITEFNRLCIAPQKQTEFHTFPETMIDAVRRLERTSLFPHERTALQHYRSCVQDIAVMAYTMVGSGAASLQKKSQTLEELCAEFAQYVGPDGLFERVLEDVARLAQTLKDEKSLVKQIAEQIQNYDIERIVGFTDALQAVVSLLQDVAKTDGTWGQLLQKINPNLHAFLLSARSEKLAETVEAAREIAKDMGCKQPISQLALICARHGATIKLACEAAKPLVQKTTPFFMQYKKNFSAHSQSLASFASDMQLDAFEMQQTSLTEHDVAQSFELLAQTSAQVDAIYTKYLVHAGHVISNPLPVVGQDHGAAEQHDQKEKKASDDIPRGEVDRLNHLFHDVAQLRIDFWDKSYTYLRELTIYQQHEAWWKRCLLGWLYERWYHEQHRQKLALLEDEMDATQKAIARHAREVSALFETIHARRADMDEPLCAQRLEEFIEKAKLSYDDGALKHMNDELLQQERNLQARLQAKRQFPRWNITNVIAQIWWFCSYPARYPRQRQARQELSRIHYLQSKALETHAQIKKSHEQLQEKKYRIPDEICKRYLGTLHPVFTILVGK